MRIGQILKWARLAKGFSQHSLANRAEITPGYIALIEAGTRQPSRDMIERLAVALGIPVSMLYFAVEAEVIEERYPALYEAMLAAEPILRNVIHYAQNNDLDNLPIFRKLEQVK